MQSSIFSFINHSRSPSFSTQGAETCTVGGRGILSTLLLIYQKIVDHIKEKDHTAGFALLFRLFGTILYCQLSQPETRALCILSHAWQRCNPYLRIYSCYAFFRVAIHMCQSSEKGVLNFRVFSPTVHYSLASARTSRLLHSHFDRLRPCTIKLTRVSRKKKVI